MVTISLRTHQPCSGTEEMMGTKLERIAEISATTPKPEFTSLYHLINAEMLLQCHKELDGNKAMGVDKVSKAEYAEHLEENITNLVERLKKKAYKPLPSLREMCIRDRINIQYSLLKYPNIEYMIQIDETLENWLKEKGYRCV